MKDSLLQNDMNNLRRMLLYTMIQFIILIFMAFPLFIISIDYSYWWMLLAIVTIPVGTLFMVIVIEVIEDTIPLIEYEYEERDRSEDTED